MDFTVLLKLVSEQPCPRSPGALPGAGRSRPAPRLWCLLLLRQQLLLLASLRYFPFRLLGDINWRMLLLSLCAGVCVVICFYQYLCSTTLSKTCLTKLLMVEVAIVITILRLKNPSQMFDYHFVVLITIDTIAFYFGSPS